MEAAYVRARELDMEPDDKLVYGAECLVHLLRDSRIS